MPSRELPARPNLEQLKKQAKSLLDAARARDPNALRRFAVLPSLSGKSIDQVGASDLALHDAQSAVAREYGFASWNALREEVESRTLSFDAAVDEFIRCATGGATGRAEQLLALHPRLASATLQTALVLGDAVAVEDRLRNHPELALQPGGPQNWEPLLYVCHTSMHKVSRPVSKDSSTSPAVSARSARIPTPSTTGTGTPSFLERHCGVRSAPSDTCR